MYDFWALHDKGYRLFSQFCDPNDWYNILRGVADELQGNSLNHKSKHLLDIGAGTGQNTQLLLELLFANGGPRDIITAVEPSELARGRIKNSLLLQADGGFLARILTDIDQIGPDRFDAIVLLHSSYYIPDFEKVLSRLYTRNLHDRGSLVVLALSAQSPFFLGRAACYKNVAEEIMAVAARNGWATKTFNYRSQFRFPAWLKLSEPSNQQLYKFIANGSGLTYREYRERFEQYMVSDSGVDLRDRLIHIEKR